MNDDWEGTDYTICPSCKEVVLKESLRNHTHTCWSPKSFIKESSIPDD